MHEKDNQENWSIFLPGIFSPLMAKQDSAVLELLFVSEYLKTTCILTKNFYTQVTEFQAS